MIRFVCIIVLMINYSTIILSQLPTDYYGYTIGSGFALSCFNNPKNFYYRTSVNDGFDVSCLNSIIPPRFGYTINDGFAISCDIKNLFPRYGTSINDGFDVSCLNSNIPPSFGYTINDGFAISCDIKNLFPRYGTSINDGFSISCLNRIISPTYRYTTGAGFGYFCSGYIPLPINFVDFQCKCSGDRVVLVKWKIQTNEPLPQFVVQKSSDGYNFTNVTIPYEMIQDQDTIVFFVHDVQEYDTYFTYYRLLEFSHDGLSKILAECASEPCFESLLFSVYPNPVYQTVTIEVNTGNITYVRLRNNLGQLLMEEKIYQSKTTLDLAHLPSGVYYLEIFSDWIKPRFYKIVKE
ncbi:MAG: T9SS type A sorting domain-containing protein [Bacteroidales bacterium]|nr:T9SS type A sorting domain-containing protein [Bacteroidales bacterium]